MVFQDFDMLQERRRQDRQRKLKKRLTIAAVVILVIAGILVAGGFAFVSMKDGTNHGAKKSDNNNGNQGRDKPPSTPPAPPANDKPPSSTPPTPPANGGPPSKDSKDSKDSKKPSKDSKDSKDKKNTSKDSKDSKDKKKASKDSKDKKKASKDKKNPLKKPQSVAKKFEKAVCDTSAYKKLCETALENNLKKNPNLATQPKELAKSFITSTNEEIDKALAQASTIQLKTEADKRAFLVCQEVMGNAREELMSTADKIGNINGAKPPKNGDLNSQLSAVMSYQETCVDGFQDQATKDGFRAAFNSSQVYTSNSLAMVKQLPSLLSSGEGNNNKKQQGKRRLLQAEFPSWLNHEEHRLLKEKGGDEKTEKPTPNVTVALDGSGNFRRISEALIALPPKFDGRFVIFVKAGIYEEDVIVTKGMENVTIYGEGSQKTIISGRKSTRDGIPTYLTATFVAAGRGFMARAVGFRNIAGPEFPAVAARVSADRAIFVNCRFEGFQNTLYAQTHRQFYRNCWIQGTIDFISGDATAVFQKCNIFVMKPMPNQQNTITAQSRRDKLEKTGFVIQNSKISAHETFKAEAKLFKSFLGRPMKEYSRTIIMQTEIGEVIDPAGWVQLNGDFALATVLFGEFDNKGPGAETKGRVKWKGRKDINKEEATKYTVETFLNGKLWVNQSGVPVRMGFES